MVFTVEAGGASVFTGSPKTDAAPEAANASPAPAIAVVLMNSLLSNSFSMVRPLLKV
jgi:hypothetical protein